MRNGDGWSHGSRMRNGGLIDGRMVLGSHGGCGVGRRLKNGDKEVMRERDEELMVMGENGEEWCW